MAMSRGREAIVARTLVVLALGAIAVPEAASAADAAAPLEVSVATGASLMPGRVAVRWSELVAESGAGLAMPVLRVHPGAVLAQRSAAREPAALRDGTLDFAVGSALEWSVAIPALGVYALPWIAPDETALRRLVDDPAVGETIGQALDRYGIAMVAVGPLGHRDLLTSVPIRAPSDLAGLRVRTAAPGLVSDVLAALSAIPAHLPLADAQDAFVRGDLKGQEAPATSIAASRVAALGPTHLTQWYATADAVVIAARKATWERLTPPQRERLLTAARAAVGEVDPPSREEEARRRLAGTGVTIARLTPAGQAAFAAAAAPAALRWRSAIGEDLAAKADAAVASVAPGAIEGGQPHAR
jgi:TRAP-type transport system periplasmic protein